MVVNIVIGINTTDRDDTVGGIFIPIFLEVVLLIVVNVSTTGITVDGHAGYAETGKDIICASVSVLTQGLVHSLESLTNDEISYHVSNGHIDINYKDLSERGCLLVDYFFIAVSDIQNAYGNQYVQIR